MKLSGSDMIKAGCKKSLTTWTHWLLGYAWRVRSVALSALATTETLSKSGK